MRVTQAVAVDNEPVQPVNMLVNVRDDLFEDETDVRSVRIVTADEMISLMNITATECDMKNEWDDTAGPLPPAREFLCAHPEMDNLANDRCFLQFSPFCWLIQLRRPSCTK